VLPHPDAKPVQRKGAYQPPPILTLPEGPPAAAKKELDRPKPSPRFDGSAPGTRVVVVAPLHAGPMDARLGEAIGEVIALALADRKDIAIVERPRLEQVLQEQRLSATGFTEPETAARVGKLLQADLVVAGSLVETGATIRGSIQVVTVATQQLVGTAAIDAPRDQLAARLLPVAARVAELVGVKLPPLTEQELDDSPVGRLHLMRGIGFYHANQPDQAIVSCLRAVQLDPRLQEARLWIARSYARLGETSHARRELQTLERAPAPIAMQARDLLKELR
jgi:TolB-like protein